MPSEPLPGRFPALLSTPLSPIDQVLGFSASPLGLLSPGCQVLSTNPEKEKQNVRMFESYLCTSETRVAHSWPWVLMHLITLVGGFLRPFLTSGPLSPWIHFNISLWSSVHFSFLCTVHASPIGVQQEERGGRTSAFSVVLLFMYRIGHFSALTFPDTGYPLLCGKARFLALGEGKGHGWFWNENWLSSSVLE